MSRTERCMTRILFGSKVVAVAAPPGFEPGSKDSKSFVLPLHHGAERGALTLQAKKPEQLAYEASTGDLAKPCSGAVNAGAGWRMAMLMSFTLVHRRSVPYMAPMGLRGREPDTGAPRVPL